MKTIKHTKTLVYYDGVQVFAGKDADGGNYIGTMIDTVGDADRYLVVTTAPDPLRRFYAGDLDLRTLLLDDDFERPVSLEPQQGPLLEMAHLPEAGFRLGKTPADDWMSANPADD